MAQAAAWNQLRSVEQDDGVASAALVIGHLMAENFDLLFCEGLGCGHREILEEGTLLGKRSGLASAA